MEDFEIELPVFTIKQDLDSAQEYIGKYSCVGTKIIYNVCHCCYNCKYESETDEVPYCIATRLEDMC